MYPPATANMKSRYFMFNHSKYFVNGRGVDQKIV